MNPENANIKFRYLPSNVEPLPPCQSFCCGAPAVWEITFRDEPPDNHNPPLRDLQLCWAHAIHWCAKNLPRSNTEPENF